MHQFASKAIIPRTMAKFSQLLRHAFMAVVISRGHNWYWDRTWEPLVKKKKPSHIPG